MPALPHIHYTIEDYEQWEGDWELIEGMPVAMSPAPVISHQLVNTRIMTQLSNSLETCEQCMAITEAEWRLDNDTAMRPDGVVICYKPGRYLDRPPVLAVEVISPSTAEMDERYKFERYAIEGVQYYLLVWPEDKRAKVFRRNSEGQFVLLEAFVEEGIIDLPFTDTCSGHVDFGKIFAEL